MAESVKVVVRCRPMNSRELSMNCKNVVILDDERCTCSIVNPADNSAPPKTFTFDGVYSINSTTEQIYNESAYPLIEGVLEGYNSTVFAYGQTGCGKSFSMQGVKDPAVQRGIIPRAFEHIFEAVAVAQATKYLVLASYLEIYNEEIRDLLGTDTKKKLDLKETPDRGVYVQDLTWHAVGCVADCERLMSQGWSQRATGATLMNADSSRSHSIFSVVVETMTARDGSEASVRRGKLSLVDLAGSERQAKTGAAGERLKEASKINLSLSALGNVISALVDGKAKHIPYRDSKLTRLLQDSLGGNTKTLMVACLSPADNNYDETLSTLRYANRAKNIKNKPHINEDPKDTLLRQYQEEIEKLKQLLETSTTPKMAAIVDEALLQKEREKVKLEYEKELEAMRQQFNEMHSTKCQVQQEFDDLKSKYDNQIRDINKKSALQPDVLTIVDGEVKEEDAPTLQARIDNEDSVNSNPVQKPSRQEIMARLAKLERSLVGGEKAGDQSLKERRARRKRAAERKLAALAEVLSKEEHGDLVLGVVDDMADQLTARSEHLKKHRMKVRALEREITDLQSEFETERTDYLETIRKLEQQVKLHAQIIERILPLLRNHYNYSNVDEIKSEAKWDEDCNCWDLPELIMLHTKLPPAGDGEPGKVEGDQPDSPTLSKSDKNEEEDFAGNYFKPKRATEILMKAQQDVARANSISKGLGLSAPGSRQNGFLNNSWSGTTMHNPWIDASLRKPIKLEALPVMDRKNKSQFTSLDVI